MTELTARPELSRGAPLPFAANGRLGLRNTRGEHVAVLKAYLFRDLALALRAELALIALQTILGSLALLA